MIKRKVITIDGPSGSGKSTVAKQLSNKLNWSYLDSGAIYRVVAFYALENRILDTQNLLDKIANLNIDFIYDENNYIIYLDEQDISAYLREESVGEHASFLAQDVNIRKELESIQRNFSLGTNLVTDGRDMGTKIFPDAEMKIFLTATIRERAVRRFFELQNRGYHISIKEVEKQMQKRDERDSSRSASPLQKAPGSITIDTTTLSINEVVDKLFSMWHNLCSRSGSTL
ncbi:MAG: (d)CMP kinase [Pseudomonadota bacterium]|nr:(d)CMP kinase [Pseudomonadota bacterium]